ncbi:MAG TPA: DUF3471 domain-containing protein [Sphingomonadaceae bacterium]|nr:DUF3471 domain-containing protein [Sphingomonadaceae bacterium]
MQPALPLERYVGTYRSPLYGELRVTRKGDKLTLILTDQLTGEITAQAENSFLAKWRDPYFAAVGSGGPFVFEPDSNGQVQAVRFEIPGEMVAYNRVPSSTQGTE